MDNLGDLFGGIIDAFGGERGLEGIVEAAVVARGGEGQEVPSQTETLDRVLAGARRNLNVNDR